MNKTFQYCHLSSSTSIQDFNMPPWNMHSHDQRNLLFIYLFFWRGGGGGVLRIGVAVAVTSMVLPSVPDLILFCLSFLCLVYVPLLIIWQRDCPTISHEHGFPMDVWSTVQIDNLHHIPSDWHHKLQTNMANGRSHNYFQTRNLPDLPTAAIPYADFWLRLRLSRPEFSVAPSQSN